MQNKMKLTKSTVDSLVPKDERYAVWDEAIPGLCVSITPLGVKTFALRYRPKYANAPKRFLTLGRYGVLTPEEARRKATAILGQVADGKDPAFDNKLEADAAIKLESLCDRFLDEHARSRRKKGTVDLYGHVIATRIKPALGDWPVTKIARADIARLHHELRDTPVLANRVVAVMGTMFSWAGRVGLIPEEFNPAKRIQKYREVSKERFLSNDEYVRLGKALADMENRGIPYQIDESKPTSKHAAKPENRLARYDPSAVAAIRLLMLTGCRVREILNLRWAEVDFERGFLHLPDSKTGKKTVILPKAAIEVIAKLPRLGEFVIPGKDARTARTDLKRPWNAIRRAADLPGVRLHDLRHSYASVGAAAGLGLLVIGKLLGHTQPRTTAKYAHLADSPARTAAEVIASQIVVTTMTAEKPHNGRANDITE